MIQGQNQREGSSTNNKDSRSPSYSSIEQTIQKVDQSQQKDLTLKGKSRKKYNVISEEVRLQIIQQLTHQNINIQDVKTKNITSNSSNNPFFILSPLSNSNFNPFYFTFSPPQVAKEHNLKLSTCQAILNVFQKEGRIGKQRTRDRQSQIVHTIIFTSINPFNPSESTIKPYITINQTQITPHSVREETNQELVSQAIRLSIQHIQRIFDPNFNSNPANKDPQSYTLSGSQLSSLQNTLLNAYQEGVNKIIPENQGHGVNTIHANTDNNNNNNNLNNASSTFCSGKNSNFNNETSQLQMNCFSFSSPSTSSCSSSTSSSNSSSNVSTLGASIQQLPPSINSILNNNGQVSFSPQIIQQNFVGQYNEESADGMANYGDQIHKKICIDNTSTTPFSAGLSAFQAQPRSNSTQAIVKSE